MKWSKSRKHYSDYYAWQDLFNVMAVTLVLAIIATFVVVLLLTFMNPRLVTAGDITNFRTARRMAAEPVKILYMEITAYSPTVAQTDASPLITASGKRVYVGGIAADLSVFPFGTKLQIPGYNGGKPCTVIDSGGVIHGNKLDVFLWSTHEAVHFGRRRNVRVRVLYVPKAVQ